MIIAFSRVDVDILLLNRRSHINLLKLLSLVSLANTKMTIPPEIFRLVEQLTDELDRIEQQANRGLVLASQLLERFPDNVRLIGLSASVGNVLFFVSSFRNRIERIIGGISGANVSIQAMQEAGEELSEMWGRVQECKMMLSRSVSVLEDLQ
jgi:hypothetical protein